MRLFVIDSKILNNLVNYRDAIDIVEEAFKNKEIYGVELPPRQEITLDAPTRFYGSMAAYLYGYNILGAKLVTYFFENEKIYGISPLNAIIILFDGIKGAPLALVEGNVITTYRTGAMGAVSSKYLAKRDVETIGLIGAGIQGEMQLKMHLTLYPHAKVLIYDLITDKSKVLAKSISREFNIEAYYTENSEDVIKSSDILITATTSVKPVVKGKLLREGVHIISIGYVNRDSRELDNDVIARATKIYVDSKDAVSSGDIRIPLENKVIKKSKIKGELSQVIVRKIKGRENDREITVFKSVGTAILDIAMAYKIYRKAYESGLKKFIEL